MVRWESMEEMEIYGGADAIDRIRDLLFSVVLRGNRTPVPLVFHKLSPGVIFEDKNLSVSCFPVTHRGTDSFGFRFEEKGRRPFLAEKASELQRYLASSGAGKAADDYISVLTGFAPTEEDERLKAELDAIDFWNHCNVF